MTKISATYVGTPARSRGRTLNPGDTVEISVENLTAATFAATASQLEAATKDDLAAVAEALGVDAKGSRAEVIKALIPTMKTRLESMPKPEPEKTES